MTSSARSIDATSEQTGWSPSSRGARRAGRGSAWRRRARGAPAREATRLQWPQRARERAPRRSPPPAAPSPPAPAAPRAHPPGGRAPRAPRARARGCPSGAPGVSASDPPSALRRCANAACTSATSSAVRRGRVAAQHDQRRVHVRLRMEDRPRAPCRRKRTSQDELRRAPRSRRSSSRRAPRPAGRPPRAAPSPPRAARPAAPRSTSAAPSPRRRTAGSRRPCRAGSSSAKSILTASARCSVAFANGPSASRSAGSSERSTSTTCRCATCGARNSDSTPEPAADLQHHVARLELGRRADHAQDVVVDQEVLAELAVGPDAELAEPAERAPGAARRSRPEDARGVRVDHRARARRTRSRAARPRSAAVCARSRARSACRAPAAAPGRASRSRRAAARSGSSRAALLQVGRLRVGHVARERASSHARRTRRAGRAPRSSAGSPRAASRRARAASRTCRPPPRACGSRPAARRRAASSSCASNARRWSSRGA